MAWFGSSGRYGSNGGDETAATTTAEAQTWLRSSVSGSGETAAEAAAVAAAAAATEATETFLCKKPPIKP